MQACAYRELILRQRVNDAARGVMLAYAVGSDLDQLAALFGIARNESETDESLRYRVQQSLEAHTTAGSYGSYVYWVKNTHSEESGGVKDVYVTSDHLITPGAVFITVLAKDADGAPNQALLDAVSDALDDDVRPLTDQVFVYAPANIFKYKITASLYLYSQIDSETTPEEAESSLTSYVEDHHLLGNDITVSGIYAALHVTGVQDVDFSIELDGEVLESNQNIVVESDEVAFCEEIDVNIAGYRV